MCTERENTHLKEDTNMNNAIGKEQTIGVEIEFAGITRAVAAKKIADFFEAKADHTGGSYDAYEIKDQTGRIWKVVSDSSIRDIPERRCELVTPILRYEDIETLQAVTREVWRIGGRSDATLGCGVHIHIGAKGHTAQSLRNLTNLMASHENLLIDSLKVDRVFKLKYSYLYLKNIHYLLLCKTQYILYIISLLYNKINTYRKL